MKQAILLTSLLVLIFSVLIASKYWNEFQGELKTPITINGENVFTIEPGSNLRKISKQLADRGYIQNPYYLVIYARLKKIDNKLKAGEYELTEGITPGQLLELFVSGKVKQYSLTLIEGWSFKQVSKFIQDTPLLIHTLENTNSENFMENFDQSGLSPEGQFFPDTYHFTKGMTDIEFLKRSYNRLQEILTEEWEQRDPDLPYPTPYEGLIMASLIEKETALAEERRMIAGVFVRRLQKGMKLQTDPTVVYAMGETFDGNIRKTDLSIDSPYNTYLYPGLPPTPIAIVGREAIHAAFHPAPGDTLYFVAKGDGSHHFSKTLDEHNNAVRKYQLSQ